MSEKLNHYETSATPPEVRPSEAIMSELGDFISQAKIADPEALLATGQLGENDSQEDADKLCNLFDNLAYSVKREVEQGAPLSQVEYITDLELNGRYDDMGIGPVTFRDVEEFDTFIHNAYGQTDKADKLVDNRITGIEDAGALDIQKLPYYLEDVEKFKNLSDSMPDFSDNIAAQRKVLASVSFDCIEREVLHSGLDNIRSSTIKLWADELPEQQLLESAPVTTVVAQKFSNYVNEQYEKRNEYPADIMTSETVRNMVDVAIDNQVFERPSTEALQFFGDTLAHRAQYSPSKDLEQAVASITWLTAKQNYTPLKTDVGAYDRDELQKALYDKGVFSQQNIKELWQHRFRNLEQNGAGFKFTNADLLPEADQHAAKIFNENHEYYYHTAQEELQKTESERIRIFDADGMPSQELISRAIKDANRWRGYASSDYESQAATLLRNNPELLNGHEEQIWQETIGDLDEEITDKQKTTARLYYSLRLGNDTQALAKDTKNYLLATQRYEKYSDEEMMVVPQVFKTMLYNRKIAPSQSHLYDLVAKKLMDENIQTATERAERFVSLEDQGEFIKLWHEYPQLYSAYLSETEPEMDDKGEYQHALNQQQIVVAELLSMKRQANLQTPQTTVKQIGQLRDFMNRHEPSPDGQLAPHYSLVSPEQVRKEIEVFHTVAGESAIDDDFCIAFVRYASQKENLNLEEETAKLKDLLQGKIEGKLSEVLPGLGEQLFRERKNLENLPFTSNASVLMDEYARLKISGDTHRVDTLEQFMIQEETSADGRTSYRYDRMTPEAIRHSSDILSRLYDNNSTQLSNLAPEIAEQLLDNLETADEKISRLEHIFLRKNIPDFAKLYCCANVLFEKNIDNEHDISPVLKNSEDRRNLLMTDLLKNAIRSNNRSLRTYLEGIKNAETLDADGDLSATEDAILSDFENGKKFRTRFFGFAKNLNLENADQILAEMDRYRVERDDLHRKSVMRTQDGKYKLRQGIQDGDFIKGVNSDYIHTMMRDGFNCPEMVGSGAKQDVTHWDTDCGSAAEVETDPTLAHAIDKSLAASYGNGLYVVMRNDERFSHTALEDASNYRLGTYEAYHGEANGENFRGIRTGFGSEDVDFFVARDRNAKNVWMLKQEITKTGCYTPIIDKTTEEVIFTPDDFDELRGMMSGTEHYGENLKEFHFAEDLTVPDSLAGDLHFSELVADYDKKESETRAVQTMLTAHLLVAIERSDLPHEVKEAFRNYNQHVSKDAMPGTIDAISTGSTGRFTNKPNDADFDFIWRIDNSMLREYGNKITQALTTGSAENPPVISRYGEGGGDIGKGLRKGLVDVEINGQPLEVEVDITPVTKTDKLDFSSEQALTERLGQIRSQDEEKYKQVIANIILAKQALKQGQVYKKTGENGIGGIGVENWILQHGGSLKSAAKSFLKHAKNPNNEYKNLAEFRTSYSIFDLGENHMSKGYPYDNFLDNLTESGTDSYHKMIEVCEQIAAL